MHLTPGPVGPVAAHGEPSGADDTAEHILHLPSPRELVRHLLPSLIESTIAPGVLFYVVLLAAGFKGALIAALAWSYLAAGRRLVRRQRMPGLLVLGIVLVSLRTIVSFATGSSFVYFVQPTASTFLVAMAFLVTAVAGRPLIERLAHDFCPFDPELLARPFLRRFFMRISLLWCVVLTTNAACVLWLLLRTSVQAFVVERTVVSLILTAGGIALSIIWFIRAMKEHGIAVRFSSAAPAAAG
ncbi:MAG TPA: VC0807 family protein [Acidimicrobiales bacterium]|nr:VC0807 family protein [Acidimicrobiales bacterium]